MGEHSCSVTLEQLCRPKSLWDNELVQEGGKVGLVHLSPVATPATKVQRRGEEMRLDFKKQLSQPSSSALAEEELVFCLG